MEWREVRNAGRKGGRVHLDPYESVLFEAHKRTTSTCTSNCY